MRSQSERPRSPARPCASACAAAALALLLAQSALAASTPAAPPSDAQIEAAVSTLKDDPNLFSKHKIRTLHWVSADQPTPPQQPGSLEWLSQLF